jgi:hypothetical protein
MSKLGRICLTINGVAILLLLPLLEVAADGDQAASPSYRLRNSVVGAAGALGSGSGVASHGTLAQSSPLGTAGGSGRVFCAGFWQRVFGGPRTWYVATDGSDATGNGRPDTPFATFEFALTQATAGDSVVAFSGTYTENYIHMKSGVTLRSYDGDPDSVTIDGGGYGPVIFCTDLDSTTTVEYVTIANAYTAANGGGIRITNSSPTIRECVITGCSSGFDGGGISCSAADPLLVGCRFVGNSSSAVSGGFFCGAGTARLEGCTFSGNTSTGGGGSIGAAHNAVVEISNCTLYGGSGLYAGGVHLYNESSAILTNTIIAFSTSGPSVFCYDNPSSVSLSCCDLYGNAGGNWVGRIADQAGLNGNLELDPEFCDAAGGNFNLQETSPCADAPGCGLIGAWPVGCDPSAVEGEETPRAGVTRLQMQPGRPNPSAGALEIAYEVPAKSAGARVVLTIHDVTGRCLRTLEAGPATAGPAALHWDGRDRLGSSVDGGLYFLRLTVGGEQAIRRAIVVR